MRFYTALLFTETTRRFRIEVPDFPGCVAYADDLPDVPRVAAEMLGAAIERRSAAGQPLPRPTAPEILASHAALERALPLVVPALRPVEERVSVSVELPAGLVERVDRRALSQGVDRSDLLAKAARLALWETGRATRGDRVRSNGTPPSA